MARIAKLPQKIITLLGENHLLTVGQMLEKLSSSGNGYNKTSVYRALEKLELDNLICKENFNKSEALYELRKSHHDHAVCTNCDIILTIECDHHKEKKISGFQADHHHTTVYGVCDHCSKQK